MEPWMGRQTMQLVSEQADIDLILLDLNLPDRDGFSVLSELRKSYPAISVVVLSAQQDRESVPRHWTSARSASFQSLPGVR